MDPPDTPKVRRPLPTPGASSAQQRPATPLSLVSPVPAASFYAPASQKPPPLPQRRQTVGSKHTTHLPADPPRYDSPAFNDSSSYRHADPVSSDPTVEEDDGIPDLIPQDDPAHWVNSRSAYESNNSWQQSNDQWTKSWQTSDDTAWRQTSTGNETSTFEPLDYMSTNRLGADFNIDGREEHEELSWWDPEERAKAQRPGPGILPPILAEDLHDPNHSLFIVHTTSPNLQPSSSASQAGGSSSSSSAPVDAPLPTEDEFRTAHPHPHAYYCPKDNSWVIMVWRSSSVPPPLARSFQKSPHIPLPDQSRRRRTNSCIEDSDQPFGRTNKTHHFHKYEKAIDGHKLTTPFREDEWQSFETVKRGWRVGAIINPELNIKSVGLDNLDSIDIDEVPEEEGKLMDLYICCQCSFHCISSGTIPGVIPRKYMDELLREKKGSPPIGKTGEQSVALAVETFLTAIENKIWKGNHRMIKVQSSGFQSKLGWSLNVKRVFELLGFNEESIEKDSTLKPPATDISTPQGRQNRRKLLRAWVELSAWLVDFKRINAAHFKDVREHKLWVSLDNARETYQTAVGAHPDQMPRGGLSDTMREALKAHEHAWLELGLTASTYSPEFLAFAYLAQCRCNPAGTPTYFTHLANLVKYFERYETCPAILQELLAMEQSRDRFTLEDVEVASRTLGFGAENMLRVDYGDDIPDNFVENAWRDTIKRCWRDPSQGAENQRLANEAFRVLAETRNSAQLRKQWELAKNVMSPERAYDTLEIPKEVDDEMVITVFTMRLEDAPLQGDKMREALNVIAEVRDSERLRQFISTGLDPGVIVAPTRPDFPRGLNQLGNTCYLNSLLQYFYTIKDLREAVLPMSQLDVKALDDEKFSEEDLKRHRVGGRLVTRREIVRSRKFINQLAALFYNLEFCDTAAVTPTIELAKLALVTSKDEEEDEIDGGKTDSSNDTDATLVEDGPTRSIHSSQSPGPSASSSATILGKRPRDIDRQASAMEVDSPLSQSPKETDGFVFVPSQREPVSTQVQAESSKRREVEQKSKAPAKKRAEVPDSGGMMFGKQHDVAECMDNCMFQIETALLKFDEMSDDPGKTSVVKRLFYGKIRQRLTGSDVSLHSRASIHEKEDLFSHLPVNVADDGIDIYDGLSGYFDDVVDFEGRKARMEMTLVELPPLLQIQLQRVQFNRETLQPYKSQAYVKFGENLYMDRFLDGNDPAKKTKSKAIQSELAACRERARLLVEGKTQGTPYSSSLNHTKKFLAGLQSSQIPGMDDSLLHALEDESQRIGLEVEHLRARIDILKEELETLWKDCTEAAYELTSVFIHRGSSPSFGHYFFYSRHLPDAPDSWFKYNDSDVTVVSKDEVLADTSGSTANPYLLVFARKGADIVDTVKRFDPASLPP